MNFDLFKIIPLFFLFIFLLIAGTVALKFAISKPKFHYSDGERIGVLRKLSKKGLIHKTYEGELMLNAGYGAVKLDTFNFSVSDEQTAKRLNLQIGKEIKLH